MISFIILSVKIFCTNQNVLLQIFGFVSLDERNVKLFVLYTRRDHHRCVFDIIFSKTLTLLLTQGKSIERFASIYLFTVFNQIWLEIKNISKNIELPTTSQITQLSKGHRLFSEICMYKTIVDYTMSFVCSYGNVTKYQQKFIMKIKDAPQKVYTYSYASMSLIFHHNYMPAMKSPHL